MAIQEKKIKVDDETLFQVDLKHLLDKHDIKETIKSVIAEKKTRQMTSYR